VATFDIIQNAKLVVMRIIERGMYGVNKQHHIDTAIVTVRNDHYLVVKGI
jgi:hypothetical protein